ncbi:unnamed protein product, partial [Brassica napus]
TISHAEVVQDGSSSEDDNLDEDNAVKKFNSLGHARNTDAAGTCGGGQGR